MSSQHETPYTAEQLRNMGINELVAAIEKHFEIKMDPKSKIELAMLHGAKETGITMISGPDMISAQQSNVTLNYERLASVLNEPKAE